MKLKLTVQRPGAPVDLVVTADATATVADVTAALIAGDPLHALGPGASGTLRVTDPFGTGAGPRTLDPAASMGDAALLSGSSVEVVGGATGASLRDGAHGTPVARVRILTGPEAGSEFAIPAGSTVIGRDRDVDIRLSDPMVSKRHARLNVADAIEIIDLNSANGVIVDGDLIGRAAVAANDVITIGDTTLCVFRVQQSSSDAVAPHIEHVRSPRVVPLYPGTAFPAPHPPKRPEPQRLPLLALVAPLMMGAVMWAITQQLLGVIMMAMSPLLLIGGFIDQRVTSRRTLAQQKKDFAQNMLRMQERLDHAREDERRARLAELPSAAELRDDARRLGSLLWTDRAEHPAFLTINAGTGTVDARNQVELPATSDTPAEFWEQLLALQNLYGRIDRVPVAVNLRESGSLGIAGAVEDADGVARSVVLQLACRHSPADLAIAALVSSASRAQAWDWLKWMPHTSSTHSPLGGIHLADSPGAGSALLARLEGVIDARVEGAPSSRGPMDESSRREPPAPVTPAVLLIVDNAAPVDRARLTRLVERGPDAGVHVVWIAPREEQLPAGCRSFISLPLGVRDAVVGQVRDGARMTPVEVDAVDVATVVEIARMLAPVIDVGVPEADDSDLPRSVPYPTIAGTELLDAPDSIVDRWRQNNSLTPRDGSAPVVRRKEGNLRALVGHAGSELFTLDLRADGPHALVGGTTGAGKSEFLQAWVLGMAAAHSPDRLTFLFVDYKGGAAFADCVNLPHTVGLVTDLSPHLVRRALTSLRAELRYREHLLNRKKAKDLVSLEKSGDPECPPSLVIIVDEFAALVNEVPEFVDGVVDVAQRGRSLGLHLVLATQRPAGVIRDNLRANTNLRIALRMADEEDSSDILGDKMAAYFDPSIPGRGAAKTGPGRIRAFQTGYAGGRTTGEVPAPRIDIAELDFGAGAEWEKPVVEAPQVHQEGPNDISRIVNTVRAAADAAGVPEPRKPWLDELAPVYDFSLLPNPRTDARLPLGVVDEPETQSQPTVFYEPDVDGNLAIYGTGGSGKSTVLRTIAVAAAATTRNGGPVHVYGLDFGSRGLAMLSDLPHVGAIVSGDDEERVIRTIRMLRDLVDERAVRYSAVSAGTIGEYRRIAGAPDEPRVLLLVDGIGAFKEQYEFGSANLSAWFTAFAQVAADGRAVGVHVVVAGDRPNSVPTSIASTVQRRIVLRMANDDEYLMLGVPRDVISATSPAGRGILDGNEVQLAILGSSGNVAVQAREMKRLGASLGRAGAARPRPVLRLADQISLASLPAGTAEAPVIGVEDLSLGPIAAPTRGTLLVAGPPSSGRTTALVTIAVALQRTNPEAQRVLLAPRRSALSGRGWAREAVGVDAVITAARDLIVRLESAGGGAKERLALFIESLPEFTGTDAEYELERLIRLASREEQLVIGEGETSTWQQAYTLAGPFKSGRKGLLLVPGDMDGDNLMGTSLGRIRRADFPPGRGFLVINGRAARVQIAQAMEA